MIAKPRKFKLHFNRNNMRRGLPTVWTIHLSNRCIPAKSVHVEVPIATMFKPEGRQPRAWFSGEGYVHDMGEGWFIINNMPPYAPI